MSHPYDHASRRIINRSHKGSDWKESLPRYCDRDDYYIRNKTYQRPRGYDDVDWNAAARPVPSKRKKAVKIITCRWPEVMPQGVYNNIVRKAADVIVYCQMSHAHQAADHHAWITAACTHGWSDEELDAQLKYVTAWHEQDRAAKWRECALYVASQLGRVSRSAWRDAVLMCSSGANTLASKALGMNVFGSLYQACIDAGIFNK